MIIYSVTIVLKPEIEAEWLEWMRTMHVPDVLRAGCFQRARIAKVLDAGDGPCYRMQYDCPSLADYHRYRDQFAPALQKDHTDRYAGRFRGDRQLLEVVAELDATGS